MGGVSGTLKRSTAADQQQKKKNEYDNSNDDDDDVYHPKMPSYDSGELFFQIAREMNLKPSITVTFGANKLKLRSFNSQSSALKESKVQILAFEVANTIVKGSNLMQSLFEENIQILKMEILHSKGVQLLVSTDIKELLGIAAADKREEFEVFWRDVVRFGDMCKDAQWHNLDRLFTRPSLDPLINKPLRQEVEIAIQELTNRAQHTFELYHGYHALDRIEQLYRRKSFVMLQNELKQQRKLVTNLKRKSLWYKSLAEITEKLVDVVFFIHREIVEAFEENGTTVASSTENGREANETPERLGGAGLALHYANLITLMGNIASRPTCLPSNIRDTLYNGLPASVKAGLRSRLQGLDSKEVMTMPQIKAEMEDTLSWLVPIATNTSKAHQGFGWVGEWANTGNEFGQKTITSNNIIRLQTLYHADKQKMDGYILNLIIYLHRLINLAIYRGEVHKYTPTRSPPTSNGSNPHPNHVEISSEEKNLLEEMTKPDSCGESKCQEELVMLNMEREEVFVSSRSMGSSPRSDLKYANGNMLDALNRLGTTF